MTINITTAQQMAEMAGRGDLTALRDVLHALITHSIESVRSLTAATTLGYDDNGSTLVLNLAAGFAVTLPAPKKGVRFKFIVGTAPSGGDYTIVTNGGANIIKGGINELEVDTGDDGPSSSGADTITFEDGVAVAGDWVSIESDGTSWFLTGQTVADGGASLSAT